MTPSRVTGLSPHEILMGRPMRMPASLPSILRLADIHVLDTIMLDYCRALVTTLKDCHSEVVAALPKEPLHPCHSLVIGDWVLFKIFQQKNCLAPRWKDRSRFY